MIEQYLESTNLNEDAKWKDIRDFVQEAVELNVYGVCTYLSNSGIVNKYAKGSNLKKIYVLGFASGDVPLVERDLFYVKTSGGDEFDLVFPLRLFIESCKDNPENIKKFYMDKVKEILTKVRKETEGKILKVIIETNILREITKKAANGGLVPVEEIIAEVVKLSEEAGADFIKTNTGRYKRHIPIQLDVVEIQKSTKLPIKAAGGIRDYQLAKVLVDMGVSRIGTSNARTIIEEMNKVNVKEYGDKNA
jgi:deoxyribose-phosphate aldolase